MECKEIDKNNYLENSGCSILENSQLLYPNKINDTQNILEAQKFHNHLRNYHNVLNNRNNFNQKYHFDFSDDKLEEQNSEKEEEKEKKKNIDNNKENFVKYLLFNLFDIMDNIKNKEELNDISNDIKIKKESFFLTKSSYIGFKNECGDNSCYVNVVIHLLFNIIDIKNILIDIAEIESLKKDNPQNFEINISNNNNIINEEELLSNLGQILNLYGIYKNSNKLIKKVTLLDSLDFRLSLDKCSNQIFKLKQIADPVELLLYILDILNKSYKQQIHNNFYLNLIAQNNCVKKCNSSRKVRFDKDNFSYHIYITELLNYIKTSKKSFKEKCQNLFELALDSYKNEISICDKCSVSYEKYLICYSIPKYLLLNLVWSNPFPEKKDVLDFLFLLSVSEDLKNLFICDNSKENTKYFLVGIILYSFSLCHYTVIIYDKKNKVFVFYDDEIIIEYQNLFECFSQILVDNIQLYDNDKAYFYPTMLLYTRENIYNKDDIEKNVLNEFKYVLMLNKMEECLNNYYKKHNIKENNE